MLSVFIAPTGTGEYSGNLKFVCDDTSAGRFVPAEGVVVPYEAGLSYDWRAVYPYDSSLSSADQISRIASNQTQNGNGNTVYLGQYDILAGNASNASVPSIVMRHQGTLLRWTVRNASQSPISVKTVIFDKKGYAFAAVDELQYAWTGSYPQNRAPVIADRKSMAIDGKMTADYSADGSLLEGISGLFDDDSLQEVSFAAPNATGWYRLVVFVSDAANRKVASAVIPINIVDENASLTPDNWKEGATIDF